MIHGFDQQRYQQRIDRIVGVNRDGKSIIRLVHAPAVVTWALGEVVPRYWTKRWKVDSKWVYDQPDRWILERRIEKEAYWDAHNATRFQVVEATGETIDLGPPPEDFYVFEYLIAKHDEFQLNGQPQCCELAWRGETKTVLNHKLELVETTVGGRRRCWGEYREPNDFDLQNIARAVQKMKNSPYYSPYAPMTPEQLAAIEVQANMDAQRMADEANRLQREINADFNRLHGWRLFNTDGGKRSKFHVLG